MTAKYPSTRRRIPATSLTLSLILAFAAQPAAAEDANADTAQTPAPADTAAQVEGGSYGGDIVVTARRRAETAQVKRTVGELEKTPSPAVGVVLNAFAPGSSHPHMAYRHMAEKYGYGYGKPGAKKARPAKVPAKA